MPTADDILDILRGVIDPDVGINIVDLGLVESVAVEDETAHVGLIMTTPACPQSGYLCDESERLLRAAGVAAVASLLDAPLWAPERLSPSARDALGWAG